MLHPKIYPSPSSWLLLIFPIIIAGCSSRKQTEDNERAFGKKSGKSEIKVAAASSTRNAVEAINKKFQQTHGVKTDMITGASGKLTSQILQGAPYDVFISADMQRPKHLHKKGEANAPKPYAYGVPVIWAAKDSNLAGPKTLLHESIKKIAVANPVHAPYGKAATKILTETGIYNKVRDKLVSGQSIAQVNHYILNGTVDAAITALSAKKTLDKKVNESWYTVENYQLKQGAVLTNHGKDVPKAKQYYQFLWSEKARKTWRKFGYKVVEDTSGNYLSTKE